MMRNNLIVFKNKIFLKAKLECWAVEYIISIALCLIRGRNSTLPHNPLLKTFSKLFNINYYFMFKLRM